MRRWIAICAAVFMLLICVGTVAAEDAESNVTWTLGADGTLTVSCEGVCDGVSLTEEQWKQVRTIVFTEGVTEIGDYAFSGYSNGYENIYQYTSVVLPEGLLAIDYAAFSFVPTLETIRLPSSLTELGYGAFSNSGLTSIVIPAGITRIEEATFESCPLVSVTIPDTVTSIGAYAFRETNLTEVTLPLALTVLENSAFADSKLTSVVIPEGVTELGAFAFAWCNQLSEVHLPASLTSIGSSAFRACSSELRFTVAAGSESFSVEDGILFSGDKKTLIRYPAYKTDASYTVPASVKEIADGAFYGCKTLTELILPEGLESIGGMLFCGCDDLKSITLPESLREVGMVGVHNGTSQFFGVGSHFYGPFYGSSVQEITVLGRETNIIVGWVHSTDGFAKDTTIYCYPCSATDVALRFNGVVRQQESVKVAYLEEDHEHIWTEEHLQDPTCSDYGEKRRTCTVCGYTYIEPIPTIPHTYGTPVPNGYSYIEEEHVKYTCTVCNYSTAVTVLDVEHEHEWTETVSRNPGCNAEGEKYRVCAVCNKVQFESIPKIAHTLGEPITVDATCGRMGEKYAFCTVCGELDILERTPRLEHTLGGEMKVLTPATCTEDGEGKRMCKTCLRMQIETIPATGHTYGEWTETVAPTMQAAGKEQRVCAACGDAQVREVAKLTFSEFAQPYLPHLYAFDAVLVLALVVLALKKKKK